MSSSKVSTTRSQTWFHYVTALAITAISALALREMRLRAPDPGFQDAFEGAVKSLQYEGKPVLAKYTGIAAIDGVLQFLVVAFLPGTVGPEEEFVVFQGYFLISAYALVAIFGVESGRRNNRWSLIYLPSIWALFYQTIGGAVIIPLYFLAYMRNAVRQRDYFSPDQVKVWVPYAKALLPSMIIGYLVPTILLYLPYWDDATQQRLIALWQPCPLFVSILSSVLQNLFSTSALKAGHLKHVNRVYISSIIICGAAHIATVSYCLMSADPKLTLSTVFDLRLSTPTTPIGRGLKYFFQVDFYLIFASSLVWAYLAIYDVTKTRNTDIGMIQAFVYIVLGSIALGPAAVLLAVWYWREQLLVKAKTA